MFKENNKEVEKIVLGQLLEKLKEINQHWKNLDDASGTPGEIPNSYGLYEPDVRRLEDEIVDDLLKLNFTREDLSQEEIKIIDNYLTAGDNEGLMSELAQKIGIEFKGMFDDNPTHKSIAADQVLKEIKKNKKLN